MLADVKAFTLRAVSHFWYMKQDILEFLKKKEGEKETFSEM